MKLGQLWSAIALLAFAACNRASSAVTKEICTQTEQEALHLFCHMDELAGPGVLAPMYFLHENVCNAKVRSRWERRDVRGAFYEWVAAQHEGECPAVERRRAAWTNDEENSSTE